VTEEPPPTARDLVRRRSRSYVRDETGRHHHIGAAPELQPLLGEDGSEYVTTSDVQLASRTVAQLEQQRDRVGREMAAAAEDLRFEDAARLRDDLSRIVVELARRG
jgi:excinuclease UvrABC helicase subunit UvrB